MSILTSVLESLLVLINSQVVNWGVSVMLFSLLVKLLLAPLQAAAYFQQRKVRALKPELDALLAEYKNNPAEYFKRSSHIKNKAGVSFWKMWLGVLVQIPVFFAVFQMISKSNFLKGADFLWLPSLSLADPFYLLPLLVAGVSFLQMKVSIKKSPELNKISLWILPGMSFIFLIKIPAAVVLYYLVSGGVQLASSVLLNRWSDLC